MNYQEVYGRFYMVNEGFIFRDKQNGTLVKMVQKPCIYCYECIPEPKEEDIEDVSSDSV